MAISRSARHVHFSATDRNLRVQNKKKYVQRHGNWLGFCPISWHTLYVYYHIFWYALKASLMPLCSSHFHATMNQNTSKCFFVSLNIGLKDFENSYSASCIMAYIIWISKYWGLSNRGLFPCSNNIFLKSSLFFILFLQCSLKGTFDMSNQKISMQGLNIIS